MIFKTSVLHNLIITCPVENLGENQVILNMID